MEPTQPPPLGCEAALRNGSPLHKTQQYRKSEWESKKNTIKELFIDLKLPLKDVMKIMSKEHKFHATRKMYVTRLDTWGMGKNCTKKRISNLLHQKRDGDAMGTISKLGNAGKVVDRQRIEKYLKRTKKDVEMPIAIEEQMVATANVKRSPHALTLAELQSTDTGSISTCLQHPPSVQHCTHDKYELGCLFRQWSNRFRLIEKLPNGSTYEADSFGFHSYFALDEIRSCTQHCYCRQHRLPEAFAFMVHKSSIGMDITIFSDELYANLIGLPGVEGLQAGTIDQERTLNGLILLQHYQSLRSQMDTLCRQSLHNPTHSLLSEMELLVDGLLADGEVFRSFGYENLYEQKFLDFRLWEKFQQDSFERDILALEEGFYEIDEDLEELPAPLHHLTSNGQQSLHAESVFDAGNDSTNLPASQLCSNLIEFYLEDVPPTTDEVDDSEDLPISTIQERGLSEFDDIERLVEAAEIRDELQIWLPLDGRELLSSGSALNAAVRTGNEAMTQLLLDQGAHRDGDGLFLIQLNIAAKGGHEAVVKLLLDRGAYIDGSIYGGTPLTFAAKGGHKAIVQLLLDRGADIDGPMYGKTPLTVAAERGHEAIIKLLLDRGVYMDGPIYGGTPLTVAAKGGHEAIVKLLLDRGAYINSLEYSQCPLVAAVKGGHEAVAQLLLYRCIATNDLSCMRFLGDDKSGRLVIGSAMIAAALLGRMSSLLQIFHRGVDINTVTQSGTALSTAAKNGNSRIIRWLLRKGADVNLAALILQTSDDMELQVAKLFEIASSIRNSEPTGKEKQSHQSLERAQKLRYFHRKFIGQHMLMANAGEGSSTKFRELSLRYRSYRDTWEASIETVRKLNRGERPTIADTIAYLCLAKAIQETLHDTSADDYTEPFFQDLVRWQLLFEEESDRAAYRDVIYSMWGVVLDDIVSSEEQVDAEVTIRFQALASTLISQASKEFGRIGFNERGFERSQQAWHLRNSQISSEADLTQDISILPVSEGIEEQGPEVLNTQLPDPDIVSTQSSLEQKIGHDTSPLPDHVVVFLMLGALFAIMVIFLQRSSPQRSRLT